MKRVWHPIKAKKEEMPTRGIRGEERTYVQISGCTRWNHRNLFLIISWPYSDANCFQGACDVISII